MFLTLGTPPGGEPRGQPEHPRSRSELVRGALIPQLSLGSGQSPAESLADGGTIQNVPASPEMWVLLKIAPPPLRPWSLNPPLCHFSGIWVMSLFLDTAVSGAPKHPKAPISCKLLPPRQAVWGVACFQSGRDTSSAFRSPGEVPRSHAARLFRGSAERCHQEGCIVTFLKARQQPRENSN